MDRCVPLCERLLANPEGRRPAGDDGVLHPLVAECEASEHSSSWSAPGLSTGEEGPFPARGDEMDLPVLDLGFGSALRPVFQFALFEAVNFVPGKGVGGGLAGRSLAD